jgi:hypothetical protein
MFQLCDIFYYFCNPFFLLYNNIRDKMPRHQKGKSLAGIFKALAPALLPALGTLASGVAEAGSARLGRLINPQGSGVRLSGRAMPKKKKAGRPRKAGRPKKH